MKIRLTPELSYIIGFWRKRRTKEGIGIQGEDKYLEVFSQQILEQKLTTSDKFLHEGNQVYFYHSAYRKFFQEIEKEQLERYKYMNDYAASYLAGMFDSAGGIDEKGIVYLMRMNTPDEMLFIRLGFGAKRREDKLVVERPKAFLAFIKNYVKIHTDHRAFALIGKKRRKNQ
ncbi:MAG TPA: hypothetical protein VJH24_03005 [Candidatus Bilamarchaeaceae archaeon]|nr:hypothetical protein [Candidatus Bilamarchaeaceae archaeon]